MPSGITPAPTNRVGAGISVFAEVSGLAGCQVTDLGRLGSFLVVWGSAGEVAKKSNFADTKREMKPRHILVALDRSLGRIAPLSYVG
ncbi:MAG: hypothetical protein ACFCD0_18985 [Gemmataceae bacterium]